MPSFNFDFGGCFDSTIVKRCGCVNVRSSSKSSNFALDTVFRYTPHLTPMVYYVEWNLGFQNLIFWTYTTLCVPWIFRLWKTSSIYRPRLLVWIFTHWKFKIHRETNMIILDRVGCGLVVLVLGSWLWVEWFWVVSCPGGLGWRCGVWVEATFATHWCTRETGRTRSGGSSTAAEPQPRKCWGPCPHPTHTSPCCHRPSSWPPWWPANICWIEQSPSFLHRRSPNATATTINTTTANCNTQYPNFGNALRISFPDLWTLERMSDFRTNSRITKHNYFDSI